MYGHGREVTCAVCSVEVGGMKDNHFRVPPVGGGALLNGVMLIFNQCTHEDLHRGLSMIGARQQAYPVTQTPRGSAAKSLFSA